MKRTFRIEASDVITKVPLLYLNTSVAGIKLTLASPHLGTTLREIVLQEIKGIHRMKIDRCGAKFADLNIKRCQYTFSYYLPPLRGLAIVFVNGPIRLSYKTASFGEQIYIVI